MRDRDLILIISFVMHFTGIEGHSFLWLEKFPIAIHSWLTIKIVRTNLSLFLSGEFNSLLGGSWWHCSHAAGFHSDTYHNYLYNRLTIVMNPWTIILSSYASAISIYFSFIMWMHIRSLRLHLTLFAKNNRFANYSAIKTKELILHFMNIFSFSVSSCHTVCQTRPFG